MAVRDARGHNFKCGRTAEAAQAAALAALLATPTRGPWWQELLTVEGARALPVGYAQQHRSANGLPAVEPEDEGRWHQGPEAAAAELQQVLLEQQMTAANRVSIRRPTSRGIAPAPRSPDDGTARHGSVDARLLHDVIGSPTIGWVIGDVVLMDGRDDLLEVTGLLDRGDSLSVVVRLYNEAQLDEHEIPADAITRAPTPLPPKEPSHTMLFDARSPAPSMGPENACKRGVHIGEGYEVDADTAQPSTQAAQYCNSLHGLESLVTADSPQAAHCAVGPHSAVGETSLVALGDEITLPDPLGNWEWEDLSFVCLK